MRANEKSGVFQCPDGNFGVSEPRIDCIQARCDRVGRNAPHGGEQFGLAALDRPVQDEQGTHIIAITAHVRVQDDIHRRLGSRANVTCGNALMTMAVKSKNAIVNS